MPAGHTSSLKIPVFRQQAMFSGQMWKVYCIFVVLSSLIYYSTNATSNCTSNLKVYVYDLPPEIHALSESARKNGDYHICKKCIYEQFSLEYIIYDYFTQYCGRTYNPSEADFFYLPIIREIDYRIALSNGGKRAPSVIEETLLDAIEKYDFTKWKSVFNVTSSYWQRSNGSDHIIVMPAPVTNFRHQTNMRGFFHYMMQLNAPIFLNVEFSRSFVEEYPVCATEKNIVMPYPTIDPDFYAGKLFLSRHHPSSSSSLLKRDKLIFYLGGNHGSCVFVRQALTELSRTKQIAIQRGPRKREEGFQSATFCPIPIGDSPSSKRMYDVINFGCIPVVLSDDLVWAYSIDAGGSLDPALFSLQLPQNVILKSAQYILDKYASPPGSRAGTGSGKQKTADKPHPLLNRGRPLPASGDTVLQLLREIAEEDQAAAEAAVALNATLTNTNISNTPITQQRVGTSRRLSTENLNALELQLLQSSHRHLLHIPNGNSKRAVLSPASSTTPVSNTLIRLLHKISAQDVTRLQQGVQFASQYYRFYAMNSSMRTDVVPPAVHAFPSGGALHMLEQQLLRLRDKGTRVVYKQCQEERSRGGHRYVGNYPCEKRRR